MIHNPMCVKEQIKWNEKIIQELAPQHNRLAQSLVLLNFLDTQEYVSL